MLASDSDSEFEYASVHRGNDSEASEDEGILLGKLALGIDPNDLKSYDVQSEPKNGSQYLMKVMAEKKSVPKVVSAQVPAVIKTEGVNYLDKFIQGIESGEEDNLTILPTQRWRDENVSNFSSIRSRIEKWQHLIESKAVRHSPTVKLPTTNDANHWLKFCFGDGFMKLVANSKTASKEEKLTNFFLNLCDDVGQHNLTEEPHVDPEVDDNKQQLDVSPEKPPNPGTLPLLSTVLHLNQSQIESLIKWNLSWIQNLGFVNESQGQWLYAVLGCVVKPVDPSVMSDMRGIARALIKLRSKFSEDWKEYLDTLKSNKATPDGNDKALDYVYTLNLFIYLIADYFAQKDLVMSL